MQMTNTIKNYLCLSMQINSVYCAEPYSGGAMLNKLRNISITFLLIAMASVPTVAFSTDNVGFSNKIGYNAQGFPMHGIGGANGNELSIDGLGHLDVIAHGHQEGGHILFDAVIGSNDDGDNYILIDVSDTTLYPHDNASWIHFGNLIVDFEPGTNGLYEFEIGFVSTQTTTTGDYLPIYSWSSDAKGDAIHQAISFSPENVKATRSANIATNMVLADVAFGTTDLSVGDTSDLASAIAFGEGDIVFRVISISGASVEAKVGIVYHSH